MNRREALATTGTALAVGVVGCSTPFGTTVAKVSGNARIPSEDYSTYDFAIDKPATLDYTFDVSTGPPIDILVMDRSNFQAYQNENYDSVTYLSGITKYDTTFAEDSAELSAGKYNIVLDNTSNVGATPPSDSQIALVSVDYLVHR